MSLLAAIVPYLPIILQLIGWGMKTFGASESNLRKYQELIESANREGLLSVRSYDRLCAHKAAIEERLKKKQEAQEKQDDPAK